MKASDIKVGQSYVDRHGNIFKVREVRDREVEYNILGLHLFPLACSRLEVFASAMVFELRGK